MKKYIFPYSSRGTTESAVVTAVCNAFYLFGMSIFTYVLLSTIFGFAIILAGFLEYNGPYYTIFTSQLTFMIVGALSILCAVILNWLNIVLSALRAYINSLSSKSSSRT